MVILYRFRSALILAPEQMDLSVVHLSGYLQYGDRIINASSRALFAHTLTRRDKLNDSRVTLRTGFIPKLRGSAVVRYHAAGLI